MTIGPQEKYLALHAINIGGLNPCDRSRIEQVGFSRWLDEVCATPQPKATHKSKAQIERKCAVCHAPFQASRADAETCSPRCRQRARRYGQTVTLSQNSPMANKEVTTHASV